MEQFIERKYNNLFDVLDMYFYNNNIQYEIDDHYYNGDEVIFTVKKVKLLHDDESVFYQPISQRLFKKVINHDEDKFFINDNEISVTCRIVEIDKFGHVYIIFEDVSIDE